MVEKTGFEKTGHLPPPGSSEPIAPDFLWGLLQTKCICQYVSMYLHTPKALVVLKEKIADKIGRIDETTLVRDRGQGTHEQPDSLAALAGLCVAPNGSYTADIKVLLKRGRFCPPPWLNLRTKGRSEAGETALEGSQGVFSGNSDF